MLLPRFSRWRRIRDHLCSSPLLTSFAVPPRHDLSLEFLLMRREQRKRGGICQSHSSISVTLRPLWLLLRGVLIEPLHLLGYEHFQDRKFVINACPLFVWRGA